MRGSDKGWFLGGLAVGFILGTRVGKEQCEQLTLAVSRLKENPTLQETAGLLRDRASRLCSACREKVAESPLADTKLGERLGATAPDLEEVLDAEEPAAAASDDAEEPTSPAGGNGAGPA